MREQEMKKHIAGIHNELDSFLAIGDRDSIIKSMALLTQLWQVLHRKDDGIRYTSWYQTIWVEEVAKGEQHIFNGVHSVKEVLYKAKLIRHALYRLENDFPLEYCIEAIKTMSEMNLSQTALRIILDQETENSDKILARINEITESYKG